MVKIKLIGTETTAKIDTVDLAKVKGLKWRRLVTASGNSYASAYRNYNEVLMHRLIMGAEDGQIVDHKDGDGLNNLRSNLRLCSYSQNGANRKKSKVRGASRFIGVWYAQDGKRRKRWVAEIRNKDKGIHWIKRFVSETDAARQYDDWAKETHGEFASLNF